MISVISRRFLGGARQPCVCTVVQIEPRFVFGYLHCHVKANSNGIEICTNICVYALYRRQVPLQHAISIKGRTDNHSHVEAGSVDMSISSIYADEELFDAPSKEMV